MYKNETGKYGSQENNSLIIIEAQNKNQKKKRVQTAGRDRKREGYILKQSMERYKRNKFSYDHSAEEEDKECGPGDYQIPFLTGNKGVPYSHIKTPPHYSFSKTGLNSH